jgi:hypothetical protein
LEVSRVETIVVLVLLGVERVGCDCGLDDLEGAGSCCFDDGLLKEWGWGEHAEPVVVDLSPSGSLEGSERVIRCRLLEGCTWIGERLQH